MTRLVISAALARKSLKPQLNQIRTWVRQGRTDAWIAHQLDVSVSDIRSFKREHELAPADTGRRRRGAASAATTTRWTSAPRTTPLVAAALEAEAEAGAEVEEDSADAGAEAPRTAIPTTTISRVAVAADGVADAAGPQGRARTARGHLRPR